MPQAKETQELLRSRVNDVCQSEKDKKPLRKLCDPSESCYPQMEKAWNSAELSQEWPAQQNYSRTPSKELQVGLNLP